MKPLCIIDPGPETDRLSLARKCTLPAIVLLTALGIGITVLCLNIGYTIVFQNLFYLPIILTCICYTRYGIAFSTLISAIYLSLMILIPRDPSLIAPALVRVAFFEIVAGVIVHLSAKRAEAERLLTEQRDNLTLIVAEQTKALSDELAQSHRLEQAFRESTEYHELCMAKSRLAFIAWNQERYITKVNPAFERLLGRSRNDVIGRRISTIPWLDEATWRGTNGAIAIDVPSEGGEAKKTVWSFEELGPIGALRQTAYIGVGMPAPIEAAGHGAAADYGATDGKS